MAKLGPLGTLGAMAGIALSTVLPSPAQAGAAMPAGLSFPSIDGGTIDLADYAGKAILVVNTASRCGFTRQYGDLQALQDEFADRGLVVLAVPSGDFNQELGTDAAVNEFCEVNFGLTLPMTTITPVLGADAHPFYRWLKDEGGWAPTWNFSKALIGPDGTLRGTWGPTASPTGQQIRQAVEAALPS